MQVQPYLFFDGHAQQAAEFYQQAVGAKILMMVRFKDNPDPMPPGRLPPGSEEKVMHMRLQVGDSTILMSDGHCTGKASFQGFSLSLTVPDDAAAARTFAALSQGGAVTMPLGKTFFSSSFGMLTDRFGVAWMVYVEPK